jgi:hypothetical protein
MAIVGFNFTKFDCERSSSKHAGQIEITHGLVVDDVKKNELVLSGTKADVLTIDFTFSILYSGGLGKIKMGGSVIYSDTKEIIEESAKLWESDKKLTQIISEQTHKFVYTKAIVKALELSDALSLPAPIPLPKVQVKTAKK